MFECHLLSPYPLHTLPAHISDKQLAMNPEWWGLGEGGCEQGSPPRVQQSTHVCHRPQGWEGLFSGPGPSSFLFPQNPEGGTCKNNSGCTPGKAKRKAQGKVSLLLVPPQSPLQGLCPPACLSPHPAHVLLSLLPPGLAACPRPSHISTLRLSLSVPHHRRLLWEGLGRLPLYPQLGVGTQGLLPHPRHPHGQVCGLQQHCADV